MAPTIPPTMAPVWEVDDEDELSCAPEEEPEEPVDVLPPGAVPTAESTRTLGGRTAGAVVGWVPISPLPTMTYVPLDGTTLIVTQTYAGPGWNKLAFDGSCETW